MWNKKKIFNKNQGFTLIEVLLAISIVSILSGAVLVSISSQRAQARATRMLSEMSAVMQPIYMCLADEGYVYSPSGYPDVNPMPSICSISDAYGQWPDTSALGFGQYYAPNANGFFSNPDDWFFYSLSAVGKICCNSTMMSCKLIESGDDCNGSSPSSSL